jgi:tRNA/rRNA methyltransferase
MLNHCRIVLVQPRIAGNIGATARIMHNMGLSELVLVNPGADPADRNARQQSTQGEDILDRARVVSDFAAAVADCVLVVGTSARTGGLFRRQSMGTPEEIMPHLAKVLAADHPAALVFGTEASGLTNAEVTRCQYLIHIPAEPCYPALNLAQAVAICLYELRRVWEKQNASQLPQREQLASFAAQEHMFAQLRTALEEIHFLYGPKADSLMHALRHLLGRANMTDMEVGVLRGLGRQLRWYVEQHSGFSILPPMRK